MTLLYTEIAPPFGKIGWSVVFAADRRISGLRGGGPQHYKKLIAIPHLHAALGFFGLAEWQHGSTVTRMSELLRTIVRKNSNTVSLQVFAERLAEGLNLGVPKGLIRERSGVHLSGFGQETVPEFWFVRNVDDLGAPVLGRYEARRDYPRAAGENCSEVDEPRDVSTFYRNGDIVGHVAAWAKLDEALGGLRGTPGFKPIRSREDHGNWIRFKMEVLRHFHIHFEKEPLIGGNIDVMTLQPGV